LSGKKRWILVNLAGTMNKQLERIKQIVSLFPDSPMSRDFLVRLKEDELLTRDENPYSHFCVYFAAFDPGSKKVFIGHHKKSGLWLFNGGHIDKGETPEESLEREIGEEWGVKVSLENIGEPKLLTITPINNPTKQKCTKHFDIWYFVPLSQSEFTPDQSLLDTEFHTTGWKSIDEAKALITDPNTLTAVNKFETLFNNK